ncbi:MAG: chloride channel protein [Anaerolineales bacterium]|nr:chloride channel protein [Anaerolineales bacterium]HUV28850.1 chloride channel protein [Anaerolineales bacterium]
MSDIKGDKIMKDSEILGSSDYIRLVLWIAVMAVPVALLTLIYLVLYKGGTSLVWETFPDTLNISRPVYTIMVATLGGLLVGLGLRYLGVRHGESLQKEMESGRVPYSGVPGLVVTALVGLISGASLGPEGPLGHMGAAFGSWFSQRLNLSLEKSRIMTLSGIAAAFGGFLGTPLGGAFMSMEFTGSLTYPIYANMIAATVAALIGAQVVFNLTAILPNLALPFPPYDGFLWVHLLYAVILGLVGLGMAFLFKIIYQTVTRLVKPLDRNPLLKPVVGGLIFGLVGAWLPLTLHSGEAELETILVEGAQIGAAMLLLLAIFKLFTLSICLSSGFPGGFVFPLLFSAGSLGYGIHLVFPFIPLSVAIVGMMAGIGGAIMRMPFTVILLMLMLSNPALMPISTIAAFTGFLSATLLEAGNARRAMYQASEKRRDVYLSSKPKAGG